MTSADAARARVPAPDGVGRVTRDLTRGINPVLRSLQADLVFDITDNLTIENKVKVMQTDLMFNAAFSLSAPSDAQAFPATKLPEGESLDSYQYDYAYSDGTFTRPAPTETGSCPSSAGGT